jgi:hypothetical protein
MPKGALDMQRHAVSLVLTVLLVLTAWLGLSAVALGRTWTDSTRNYHVEADLVAFNDDTVVLKKENHHLVAVPIAKLSKDDQAYMRSKEVAEQARRSADAMQMWTMKSGLKVIGRVVDYGSKEITIQRRRGKIYVNDRLFDNLPEVYQKMLPKIVAHFENVEIDDKRAFDAWVTKLRGEPRTYTCEGVLLELDSGDEYGVPFFFFSSDDLEILEPGWQRWLATDKDRSKREQESFLLQTQAQAYQQDRMVDQQIAMMQLQMQGYQAGLFDLWEVRMFPGPGVVSPPLLVVVPARDSRSAAAEAIRRNPGFVPGPVAKVRRRY